jgi:hypothetical protein
MAAAMLLLLCGTSQVWSQATIQPQTVASGGGTQSGSFGELYATIGEPIVSDSLGAIDDQSTWTGFWQIIPPDSASLGVREEAIAGGSSGATGIADVYPNPFTSSVVMELQLARPADVSLVAYDMLGREVAILAQGRRQAGTIRFDWRPDGISSGSYLLRLAVDGTEQPSRLVHYYR